MKNEAGGQKSRSIANKTGSIVSELFVAEFWLRGILTSRNSDGPCHRLIWLALRYFKSISCFITTCSRRLEFQKSKRVAPSQDGNTIQVFPRETGSFQLWKTPVIQMPVKEAIWSLVRRACFIKNDWFLLVELSEPKFTWIYSPSRNIKTGQIPETKVSQSFQTSLSIFKRS